MFIAYFSRLFWVFLWVTKPRNIYFLSDVLCVEFCVKPVSHWLSVMHGIYCWIVVLALIRQSDSRFGRLSLAECFRHLESSVLVRRVCSDIVPCRRCARHSGKNCINVDDATQLCSFTCSQLPSSSTKSKGKSTPHPTHNPKDCRAGYPSPPIDNIWALVLVWRIRRKIIRTALCCVVYDTCAQWYAHTWAILTLLHVS